MEDNGILAQVPGEYVSQGKRDLPPPAAAEDRDYTAEVDAGHVGRVLITYRPQKHKRGKSSHWFWVAVRATRLP